MVMPLHRVNVLTGTKSARVTDDAEQYATYIQKAKRPLLVLGPRLLELSLDGMRIVSARVPPEDEPVNVELEDPDGEVCLKARAVWSRRVGFRRHEIGLRFLDMTRELAAKLTRVSLNHRVPTTLADGGT